MNAKRTKATVFKCLTELRKQSMLSQFGEFEKVFRVLHLSRFSGHLQGQCLLMVMTHPLSREGGVLLFVLYWEINTVCHILPTTVLVVCFTYCKSNLHEAVSYNAV